MKLVAVSGERKGDRGSYLGTNGGRPPCHVQWEGFGSSYWVEWHDVEIVGARDDILGQGKDETVSPVPFAAPLFACALPEVRGANVRP